MEVAVCLTGYVRTFGVPVVHRSIEAVRHSLHASLFAVVSNDDGDSFRGQPKAVDDAALAAARAHVRTVDWRVVSGGDQFIKLAYCAAMIEAHELRRRVAYQWVVRLRPDGLYWPVPPGWIALLNRTTVYQSSNSGDVMWVLPRHAVSTIAVIGSSPCCGNLPTRFFTCGCEIVRTDVASATIARLGLVPTGNLGNRRDNREKQAWTSTLSTRRQPSWPGTGKGITVGSANRRLNATESHDAYVLLDRKPWSAG